MASATFSSGGGTLAPVDHLDSPFDDAGATYANHYRYQDITTVNTGTTLISSTASEIKKIVVTIQKNDTANSDAQVKLFTGASISSTGIANIFCAIPINATDVNGSRRYEFEVSIPASTDLKAVRDQAAGVFSGTPAPENDTLLIFEFLG